eukprot:TRINITY_DN66427_c0_g1_i1.p1 TRINITY_DN66427_c0_g1~~TRINITY_DN66427_c0_g1_i1.p1  ORF type:complete len:123 (+),score=46.20 TRINITY_DN66427_c0_g1_i1:203-571(+)
MPQYVDDSGQVRQVHHGYEGSKFREKGSLKPVNTRRTGIFTACFLFSSYLYLKLATSLEENNSEVLREKKMETIENLREQDPKLFAELLARGKIASAAIIPTDTPVDQKALLQRIFPNDFKD